MRRAILLTALCVALPLPAHAAPRDDDDRPFRRGTILPSLGLGGTFSSRYGGTLSVGAGASYFVVGGLGIGLHLRNHTTFLSRDLKAELPPEVLAKIPTNEFSIMPGLMWVFYRGYRVAPYITGSVGPVFLNHKRGVLGQWSVGPGILIGTGSPLWIDLGFGVSMRITRDRCERAYEVFDTSYSCGVLFGFRGGILFGLGGRRHSASTRPSPPPNYNPPPASAYPAPAEPPPVTEPVPEDSPPPSAAPPGESAPEDTTSQPPPADAEPDAVAPPPPPGEAPATPPAESPPPATTGESLYVPPPA